MASLEKEVFELQQKEKSGGFTITEEKLLLAYSLILQIKQDLVGFKQMTLFNKIVTGFRVLYRLIDKIDEFTA